MWVAVGKQKSKKVRAYSQGEIQSLSDFSKDLILLQGSLVRYIR